MTVLTRIEAGVATLTLNRPREMNAFNEVTARASSMHSRDSPRTRRCVSW
jgi:enoyl-CoA hydratase/carnithine racemase